MTASAITVAPPPLPFRLRTVFGVLLLGIAATVAVPRARAALQLRGMVNKYADYGLCMAGPTGGVLIQSDPSRFRQLVRRRLVSANAKDKPFAKCGKLAATLSGKAEVELRHQGAAEAFLEWGAGGTTHNLNELYNELPNLEQLAAKSYPFSRKPLSELVKPSLGAEEAVHPGEPPLVRPISGLRLEGSTIRSTVSTARGLIAMLSDGKEPRAFRTRDDGRTWTATSAWQSSVDGYANRCVGGAEGATYALAPAYSGNRPAIVVTESAIDESRRIEFGEATERVTALSCDATGAAVMTHDKSSLGVRICACPLASAGCRVVPLPALAHRAQARVSVARLEHTIVIAIAKDGLLRVTTSRDEGATMTPLALVFDGKDGQLPQLSGGYVSELLPMGKRLLLHLTAVQRAPASIEGYALVSDDFGASFRSL